MYDLNALLQKAGVGTNFVNQTNQGKNSRSIDDLYRTILDSYGGDKEAFEGARSSTFGLPTDAFSKQLAQNVSLGSGGVTYNGDLKKALTDYYGAGGLDEHYLIDPNSMDTRRVYAGSNGNLLGVSTANAKDKWYQKAATVGVPLGLMAIVGAGLAGVGTAGAAAEAGAAGSSGSGLLGGTGTIGGATGGGTGAGLSVAPGAGFSLGAGTGASGAGLVPSAGTWGGLGSTLQGVGSAISPAFTGTDYGLSSGGIQGSQGAGLHATTSTGSGLTATPGAGTALSGNTASGGALGTGSVKPGLLDSLKAGQLPPGSSLLTNKGLGALLGGVLGGAGGGAGGSTPTGPAIDFGIPSAVTAKYQAPKALNLTLPKTGQTNDGLWRYMR